MHPSDVRTRRAHLRLCLVTLGDPNQRTGGYRYHRMMAAAAADHRAELRFERVPPLPWPIPALPAARTVRAAAEGSDAILLDSIAAAYAAPWIARIRTPVVAVVHQPPGGVGHGRVRSNAQRRLDGLAYRSAAGIVAASETLVDELRAIGVPADRIVVVPPGSDVPIASGPPLDLRRGRGVSVLCVANWTPNKGILELLDAFATLPEGAATLWLVGRSRRRSPVRRTRPPPDRGAGPRRPRRRARLRADRGGRPALPIGRRVRALLVRRRVRNGVGRGDRGGPPRRRVARRQPAATRRTGSRGAHGRARRPRRPGVGASSDHHGPVTSASASRRAPDAAPRRCRRGERRRTGSSRRCASSCGLRRRDGRAVPSRGAVRFRRHALGLRDGGVRRVPGALRRARGRAHAADMVGRDRHGRRVRPLCGAEPAARRQARPRGTCARAPRSGSARPPARFRCGPGSPGSSGSWTEPASGERS